MQPSQNQKLPGGWKLLIASLSVTSLVGLVNLFSNEDAKTGSSQIIDALLDKPVPTLVPVAAGNDNSTASATALREVAQPAPTATLANQTPVIEKVIMGNNSGSSGPSTSTSSSK